MASRGVNKAIIIGNLGQDPEIRYSQSGAAIANISVATSESYKDNQGQQVEKSEWHRIVAFGKLAEIMGEYLQKGSKVYIEGKLQTRKWQDQQGVDRYTTEIVANELQMLGSRPQNGAQQAGNQQGNSSHQQQQNAQHSPADDFSDDIPF